MFRTCGRNSSSVSPIVAPKSDESPPSAEHVQIIRELIICITWDSMQRENIRNFVRVPDDDSEAGAWSSLISNIENTNRERTESAIEQYFSDHEGPPYLTLLKKLSVVYGAYKEETKAEPLEISSKTVCCGLWRSTSTVVEKNSKSEYRLHLEACRKIIDTQKGVHASLAKVLAHFGSDIRLDKFSETYAQRVNEADINLLASISQKFSQEGRDGASNMFSVVP